eukprot:contig_10304_g2471
MDLCGPLPVTSMGGANYVLGILDDTSGYAAAIPVRLKSQAGAAAAVTVKRWEAAVGRLAKMYRTDRGGEFVNRGMDRWASEEGLVHQTTAPYTPQQNGKAERFNRSLMEKVTAVMTAAKCDNALWAEAAATVVYAMNRTARAGQLLTPHELWSGQRPPVAHMRTFGCAAFVLTPAKFRRKLDPRGRKGIFVGYEPDTKAYRVWVSGKIVISRDVVFDESFMGDNVEEPPVEAEYDWAAVNDNDSDEGGAPSGNLAPNSAAGVADVTDQALPADEDAASDADPADGALVTADVDGTSSEAAELEMSTLLDAARPTAALTPALSMAAGMGLVKLMGLMGMVQSHADPCLFYRDGSEGERMFILVYVDDILLAAGKQSDIDSMKGKVMAAFASRDIGPQTFLGLHIWRSADLQILTVSQRQYVRTLLDRNGLTDANPVKLPMAVGVQLQKEGDALDDARRADYQTLIGGLLYLASCTRPDISCAVGKLARYGAALTVMHRAAVKTVLRYLKGTMNWGLQYSTRSPLLGYSDADHAGDVDTRRSTKGYAFVMNGGAISWQSKVQPTLATSTTEAEYIAAAQASREAIWLKLLLKDLLKTDRPVRMLCNNQSALKLIENPAGTARSKHIDVAHHFVRDRAALGDLKLEYVSTDDMVTDGHTKALPLALLAACRE